MMNGKLATGRDGTDRRRVSDVWRKSRGPVSVRLTAAEAGERRRFGCRACARHWKSTVFVGSCPFCQSSGVTAST